MHRPIAIALLASIVALTQAAGDVSDLVLPLISPGSPAAGIRAAVTPPEYNGSAVHHMLYLPPDWCADWKAKNRHWPVIVEYTGNKYPPTGSTGKVEDAALGFGISGGRFIWAVMPFVSEDHRHNEDSWWGDVTATVEYAKVNVPRICAEYGGDPDMVIICGFSRGAIGVNYIGLFDDDVARLWRGFISHDHYDGVLEWEGTTWGSPLSRYRAAAAARLGRLKGRPILVCQNIEAPGMDNLETYLTSHLPTDEFTLVKVHVGDILGPFPNKFSKHPHTDRWLLKDSPERRIVWQWLKRVLQTPSK
jgi:hypothetical protein